MNQTKKYLLFGCMAAVLVTAGSFPAFAGDSELYGVSLDQEEQAKAPVALDITAVYGKTARLGSFVPLKIRLYGQSESAFQGTLTVLTLESDNNGTAEPYEYSWSVEVSPAETKNMELYVPLGQKNGRIYLTLKDAKNRTMGETSMDFDVSKEERRLLAGVIENRPGNLNWLDGVSLNYGMVQSKTVEIAKEDFPDDPRGLSMFDLLIVNGIDCGTLDQAQKEAVADWVSDGGTLILGTGKNGGKTLELLSEMQTDITLEDAKTVWIGMGTEYADQNPAESEVRLNYAQAEIPGASERMVTDGTPLLKIMSCGNGRIGVLGIDLSEITGFVKRNPSYAAWFLGEVFREKELNKIYYYSYGRDADYWNAQNLVSGGNAKRLPNLVLYGFVIFGYLVIAGPGLYLMLKRKGLNRYYGGSLLVFSAAACVVIWAMGGKTRFTSEFCTSATILDAENDTVREKTFLNIRTPDSSGFSVKLTPDYRVSPLTRSGRYDTVRVENFEKNIQAAIGIRKEADDTVIFSRRSKAFDSRYFLLERETEMQGKTDASLTVSGGKISGYVENHLPVKLENAAVYLYGQVVILGDLEPGQRIELENEKLLVWPVGMTWLLADRVCGYPDRADDSNEEYMENIQKSGLGGYFADHYYSRYNPEVRLGGFIPSSYAGSAGIPADDQDGKTFYTEPVSCQMGKDGEIYRCGQMAEPSVSTGMGVSYGNAMVLYGTDPVIVEYDPGTDIQIGTYSFLPVSEQFFEDARYSYIGRFSGEASFYNEKTGTYDPVDIRKQDFTREELSDYIAADGKITVRYSGGNDAENGTSQALPLLMVTGREN